MNSECLKKFKDNNSELAQALVDHKKIICDLKTKNSYFQRSYFEAYDENQLLRARLTFATNIILDLFKKNTKSYTDVLEKLGIALPTNNLGCNKDFSNASQNCRTPRRNSLDRATDVVAEPAFEADANKKSPIKSHGQNSTASCFQPTSVKRPNSGLSPRELMGKSIDANTSTNKDSNGTDGINQLNRSVPTITVSSCLDGKNEGLNISYGASEHSIKRSPIGRKMDYNEEVNTSLRELKERRLSEKLPPVQDENNRRRIISPSIESTVHKPTKRTEQALHIANARFSEINEAISPINKLKSQTNSTRNSYLSSYSAPSSPNFDKQPTVVKPIAKFKNISQSGEGASGTNSQPSRSDNTSNVCSNLNKQRSPRDKEKYPSPVTLLKKLQPQSLLIHTPKKIFSSPKECVTPSHTFLVPSEQHCSREKNSLISTQLAQARPTDEPIASSRKTLQNKTNIGTSITNKRTSIANYNLLRVLSHKHVGALEKDKENGGMSIFSSIKLPNTAHRTPLKTIQTLNTSEFKSNKLLERSRIVRNISDAFKSPDENTVALDLTSNMERQTDDLIQHKTISRPKSKENISIDDNQANIASNSHRNECHISNQSEGMPSNVLHKRRDRMKTKSKENVPTDDEQLSGDDERHRSSHNEETQSNVLQTRRNRVRTKSKENVSTDDEQPIGDDERHKSSQSEKMQLDDVRRRQARARSRSRSRDNVSINDEQPSCTERPRRHVAKPNYAEPKLNTKMRRNI